MAQPDRLKLRSIGQNDYRVLEGRQRAGRIRYASERTPGIWIWRVQVNVPGQCRGGSARAVASLADVVAPRAVPARAVTRVRA